MEVSADLQHLQGGAAGCSDELPMTSFVFGCSVPVAVPDRICVLTAK